MILNAVGGMSAQAKLFKFTVESDTRIDSNVQQDRRYSIQNVDIPAETIKGFFIQASIIPPSYDKFDSIWTDTEWQFCFSNSVGTGGIAYGNYTELTRVWRFDHDAKTLTLQIWNVEYDSPARILGAGEYTLVVWW